MPKSLKKLFILILIFSWIFAGWPQIFNPSTLFRTGFPPGIQEAYAAQVTLRPNAIGFDDGWTLAAGTTKVDAVDDADPHDGNTTFINTSANNASQTFYVPNAGVPAGATINFVEVRTVWASGATGGNRTDGLIRLRWGTGGAQLSDGPCFSGATCGTAFIPVQPTYTEYTRNLPTNPKTSVAWTVTEVNNWQSGETNPMTFGGVNKRAKEGRITQVEVVVDYTPPSPVTDQNAYRWRNDNGTESTATWKDIENAVITGVSLTEIIRVRLEIEETNSVAETVTARLQFSSDATSCTDGTWTALDTSTTAWRVTASANITNGDATTNQLTSSALTFTAGKIFDTQNEDTTGVSLNNQQSEWEWAIRGDGAAAGTTYRFRVTDAGVALNTYTNCAQLTTASAAQTLTFSFPGGNSVALGSLSATAASAGSHTILVGTSAANGVAVTYSGATLASGANTITECSTNCTSTTGSEQFGINAVANTSPSVGAACSGTTPIASAAINYNTANSFRFVSDETIVSSSGSINDTTCTISYIANISDITEAGGYSATLTYVATGNF